MKKDIIKEKNIDNKKIILYVILLIFAINIFSIISDALIDCSKCHTTDPGKSAVKAKDTIVINDTTCLKCHNTNYPPTPMGYNTHLVHVGKFSAKVNFLTRHPEVAKSLQCSDCHKQIFDCTNCHVNGIPHIQPPLGLNCQGCHNQIDNLFRHPTINLTIHNIFHLNSTKDCQMCHNADSMKSLKLASGNTVPIDEAYNLCKQCHSDIYKLWNNGQHFANKTVPLDVSSAEDPNVKTDFENNWQSQNSCVNCHNPHNPSQLYVLPGRPIANMEEPTPIYYYLIPLIIASVIAIFVVRHYKIRKTAIDFKGISFPKLKLPKLSLPISISVEDNITDINSSASSSNASSSVSNVDSEKSNNVVKDVKDEKVIEIDKQHITKVEVPDEPKLESESPSPLERLDEKLTKLIEGYTVKDKSEDNKAKKVAKKLYKKLGRGDLLFIIIIIGMLGIFYLVFGTIMPMSVAISESMSPHIEKGDLIFYTDISKIDNIRTYNEEVKGSKYSSFDSYGDVIIYKPFGEDNVTPIIHRAMYYTNKGDVLPDGKIAPSEGFITKGDNQATNPYSDQETTISRDQPVKKEWVKGVAKFRIPYVGNIRLLLKNIGI